MITYKEITSQLKFLKKMVKKNYFLANLFNKFTRKITEFLVIREFLTVRKLKGNYFLVVQVVNEKNTIFMIPTNYTSSNTWSLLC